ncbi:MAG: hypothetical protein M3297_09700 [Thermoproteota archaeon]|nr:hypothetical protein [Thermoproteota archaeon]
MANRISAAGFIFNILLIFSVLCSNTNFGTNSASGQEDNLPKVPSIKIVSPEDGQLVPISDSNTTGGTNARFNNTLLISGTATDDADSPCDVSVLLNDVRPYQPTTPRDNLGSDDYSSWQFLLTPDYAPIKLGTNKITAKLECLKSPSNLTKWYSVSITGVTQEQFLEQEEQIQRQKLEQERQEQQALREIQLHKQREQQMIERAKANAAKINQSAMFVTIESHETGQYAPIGPLTISGISSDDIETDCEVYIDWNDLKPFQRAKPENSISDPGSQLARNDYSNWTFTFTKEYHEIAEGTNELTAKLDCLAYPNNYTKFSSINVTGAQRELILQQQQEAQLKQQQMIERAKANAAKINQSAMFVTIESPAENQTVPTNSSLTITGTSSDNATTDCDVSVVLNSKTPYQKALPINGSDTMDYSNWTFTFIPSYGVPKDGENEMTSRISCLAYPNNYTKFSSINVTGTAESSSSLQVQQGTLQQPQPQQQQGTLSQEQTIQQGRRHNIPNSYFSGNPVGYQPQSIHMTLY